MQLVQNLPVDIYLKVAFLFKVLILNRNFLINVNGKFWTSWMVTLYKTRVALTTDLLLKFASRRHATMRTIRRDVTSTCPPDALEGVLEPWKRPIDLWKRAKWARSILVDALRLHTKCKTQLKGSTDKVPDVNVALMKAFAPYLASWQPFRKRFNNVGSEFNIDVLEGYPSWIHKYM